MRALLLLFSAFVVVPADANNLPAMDKKPWIGWYAAVESRKFHFGVKADGEGALIPMDKRDEAASVRKWIEFFPVVEEIQPSGRIVTKKNLDDGWEAISPSTNDAEKIHYRGTCTGGARFEVNFEIDGGEISGGGRLLDKGELTENPIRFSLRVRIQNVYINKDDEEELEKLAGRDKIQLERVDGEKLKFDAYEPVWAEKEECNGPGIKTARIDLDGFDGKRVELDAGDKGLFNIYNGSLRPLYKGMTFGWTPDLEKDPEGKGRFVLEFK